MFEAISRPLQQLVELVHRGLAEWGLSLLAAGLLLRLCVLPLSIRQRRVAALFTRLRPELERIRREHASDRQAAVQAQMELVKSYHYDPRPGCAMTILEALFVVAVITAVNNWPALRGQAAFHADNWVGNLLVPDRLFSLGTDVLLVGRYFHALPFVWLTIAVARVLWQRGSLGSFDQITTQLGAPLVVAVFGYHAAAALWLLVIPWVLTSEIERFVIAEPPTPLADSTPPAKESIDPSASATGESTSDSSSL